MLRAVVAVLLPVLVPLAVVVVDRPLLGEPIPLLQEQPAERSELLWGGRVFTSQPAFAKWLRGRGASYQVWAKRHPGAAPWDRQAKVARPRDALAGWAAASLLALLLIAPLPSARAPLGGRWAFLSRLPPRRIVLLGVIVGGLVPLAFAIASQI
jgi:hypothetical protein